MGVVSLGFPDKGDTDIDRASLFVSQSKQGLAERLLGVIRGPAGIVGREQFIDQNKRAIGQKAEFELGILESEAFF